MKDGKKCILVVDDDREIREKEWVLAQEKEQKAYMQLIQKKAEQIRDLTAILLDGGKRNMERFEDGSLLAMALMFLVKNKKVTRFCFYLVVALGIYMGYVGRASTGPDSFLK